MDFYLFYSLKNLFIYNKIYTMVFFYISAPLLLGSREATIKELRQSVINRGLAKGGELNISFDKLKTENLDTLMFSNDKALKLQNGIQALLKRIDRQYFDLSDKDNHRWWVKGEKELPVDRYFSEFIWNESKYPKGKQKEKENKQQKFSIPILISLFQTKFLTVENLLKMNTNQYNQAKAQLNQVTQKEGNYNVKDLSQVIVEPHVTAKSFHNTKFVTTVVCVVPSVMIDHFQRNYWKVSNYVIPQSAKKLNVPEKDGLCLWTVDIFTQKIDQYEPHSESQSQDQDSIKKDAKKQHKKNKVYQTTIAQFIDKARETLKITVREFKFQSGQNEQRKKKREALTYKFQAHTNTLKEVLKTQFSQAYELYIHAKLIRMVIESRMRFGNDKTVLYNLEPASNKEKAVQTTLIQIFGDKQSQGLYGTKDEIDDGQDFFPFIYVPGLTF